MAGKITDRKGKAKDLKSVANEPAAFTLPDSLPCSEVDFPTILRKPAKANWKEILEESKQKFQAIEEFNEAKKVLIPKSPFLKTECDYIKNEVFPLLLPALEETLNKAKIWDALVKQKCFFNGLDFIVEKLWNNNPRYPHRKMNNLHPFNMPWVRLYLKEHVMTNGILLWGCSADLNSIFILQKMDIRAIYSLGPRVSLRQKFKDITILTVVSQFIYENLSPRPYYPKSWLWPEEYAATIIQKSVRQYFVQREDDVQEMRDFWRKLKMERSIPDMDTNPFLAKKFASVMTFKKH